MVMGLFKTKELDTEDKPFVLSVDMSSTITVYGLVELAKHLLWVEENVPKYERTVDIDRDAYYDENKYTIRVGWKEFRGNQETFEDA